MPLKKHGFILMLLAFMPLFFSCSKDKAGFGGDVTLILDRTVNADLIACIDECIGYVYAYRQGLAAADTRTCNAVDASRF